MDDATTRIPAEGVAPKDASPSKDRVESFLETLYADALADDRRLCVFTLPDAQARHFSSLQAAALHAAEEAKSKEVYSQVGLAGSNFGHRNTVSQVSAIVGLWADIDLAAPWRANKPLPKTFDEARTILGKLPFVPSMLVDSGHGFHAYWLFKEPWIFKNAEEHTEAKKIAWGWVRLIRDAARSLGWEADSVGDLARILRLPGTVNRRGDPAVEVRIAESSDRRYNPHDFELYAAVDLPPEEHAVGDLALAADAEPPADKFSALVLASPVFARTWNRQRPDLQDQSQSAYDQSLANIAALNGWTDQEIANLLVAARRKHGEKPEKALRQDYVASTVASAQAAAQERTASGVDLSGFKTGVQPGPMSLRQLVAAYPTLRPPIIEGLLREGETMNVIAQSKTGKSWMVIDLALSIASGRPWLGMDCVPGEVLILDNELHSETSAHRIPKVAAARGIDMATIDQRIHIENMRGRLQDLFALGPYFRRFTPGRFKIVILDAFYRFLPMKADENDNGTMANLYNYLDSYSDYLKCSFVLIHHTSKGNQSLKELTDVGAGAGSQSRATDTHLILRRHEEDDAVVLEAAVRSWPPVVPRCLRWAFPVWKSADDLDPTQLRQEGKRRSKADAADSEPEKPKLTTRAFVETFITTEPKSLDRIVDEADPLGISLRKVKHFLAMATENGQIYRHNLGEKRVGYATQPQQELDLQEEPTPSKRQAVANMLQAVPDLSAGEVAQRCEVDVSYVRRIRREKEDSDAK